MDTFDRRISHDDCVLTGMHGKQENSVETIPLPRPMHFFHAMMSLNIFLGLMQTL